MEQPQATPSQVNITQLRDMLEDGTYLVLQRRGQIMSVLYATRDVEALADYVGETLPAITLPMPVDRQRGDGQPPVIRRERPVVNEGEF